MLHFAAREGHTELARILVREFRLDPNALNKAGQSPLFKARCDARVMLSLLPVTTGRMWHLFASPLLPPPPPPSPPCHLGRTA